MIGVMNAYVTPILRGYYQRLQENLAAQKVTAPLSITTSNGGSVDIATAFRAADRQYLVRGGPASGVVAAIETSRRLGIDAIVTFDMGGTSADIAVATGARPEITTRSALGELPLILPVVNVSAIGAGGGSILRVDRSGFLKVGPTSAGAVPGPACFDKGGDQATHHRLLSRLRLSRSREFRRRRVAPFGAAGARRIAGGRRATRLYRRRRRGARCRRGAARCKLDDGDRDAQAAGAARQRAGRIHLAALWRRRPDPCGAAGGRGGVRPYSGSTAARHVLRAGRRGPPICAATSCARAASRSMQVGRAATRRLWQPWLQPCATRPNAGVPASAAVSLPGVPRSPPTCAIPTRRSTSPSAPTRANTSPSR